MPVSLIVAMGENRAIGKDNDLPWRIPADLKFFKAQTLGKPVVMGRKTFQSIGRPLPGRPNIVITRDENFAAEGVAVCRSLEEALETAVGEAKALGVDEVMVIGGAQIYAQALSMAERLYLTRVAMAPEADAFFPEIDEADWSESFREDHAAEGETPAYSFLILDRKNG